MNKMMSVVLVAVFAPAVVGAQNQQVRIIFNPSLELGGRWALTGMIVGNQRQAAPDNANLFQGIKYSHKSGWATAMIQRQWSRGGNQWILDFRAQSRLGKNVTLFANAAPFLTKRGTVFGFAWIERRVLPRVGIGLEADNVYKLGRDSLGCGPRVSYQIPLRGNLKLAIAAVYQVRRKESDVARLYVAVHHRF